MWQNWKLRPSPPASVETSSLRTGVVAEAGDGVFLLRLELPVE